MEIFSWVFFRLYLIIQFCFELCIMISVHLLIIDFTIQLYFCLNLIRFICVLLCIIGRLYIFCLWPCAMGGCIRGQNIKSMEVFCLLSD